MHADIAAVIADFQIPWSAAQDSQMSLLVDWLRSEAQAAGGIGPGEIDKLENRHIADSLLYVPPDLHVSTILDVGSGAGLPGLVLAIAHPQAEVTLLDRSGRRVDLMKRAVRVVGIANAEVQQRDVRRDAVEQAELVTMRAVFPPETAVEVVAQLSTQHAVIGLSRSGLPDGIDQVISASEKVGFRSEVLKVEILDPPSWLLIMTRI